MADTTTRHDTKTTTDQEEIRRWVEARAGVPATVEGTESNGQPGVLTIDFPGYGEDQRLRHISWDEWFDKFEQEGLAFLYQEQTSGGGESRFFKPVQR